MVNPLTFPTRDRRFSWLALALSLFCTTPAQPATEGTEKDRRMVARLDEIRLQKANVIDGHFDLARAAAGCTAAFHDYGIDIERLEPQVAAARIRKQAVRVELSVALDDWAGCIPNAKRRQVLLAVARSADPDSWRNRFREAWEKRNRKALQKLAADERVARQPATTLVLLADALGNTGAVAEAIAVLRQAQKGHPGDFWINHQLAWYLMRIRPAQPDKAVRFYMAALALRPSSPIVYLHFGDASVAMGKVDEAVAAYRKAIALQRDFAQAHANLGTALKIQGKLEEAIACLRTAIRLEPANAMHYLHLGDIFFQQGKLDEAVALFRRAIELDPKLAPAYLRLGDVLRDKGQLAEAIAAYRKAIQLDPKLEGAFARLGQALADSGRLDEAIAAYRQALSIDSPAKSGDARLGLANVLVQKGKFAEAEALFRQAIRLRPDWALAHCQLGLTLQRMGKFADAARALKRGHELGSRDRHWRYPSSEWLKKAEELARLDAKLPQVLKGEVVRPLAPELIALANLCLRYKHLPATAAHLYEQSFAADPKLADDRKAGHRYNAACAAALAGGRQGQDAAQHGDKERRRLRTLALAWLRADLAALDRTAARRVLLHWQKDPDLAGLRDQAALARLPDDEKEACQKLWADVAALIAKGRDGK